MTNEKWLQSARAMEIRNKRIQGYVIINPTTGDMVGRVQISFPTAGMARVHVVAWLPNTQNDNCLHHAGSGCGYDKPTAAMHGAKFTSLATTENYLMISPNGQSWTRQIENAGWRIYQAI